jgi:hypothetical protein
MIFLQATKNTRACATKRHHHDADVRAFLGLGLLILLLGWSEVERLLGDARVNVENVVA